MSEHPLEMTTSPAKSKIHPPALGLDPLHPKKGEKLKKIKNAPNDPEIILAIYYFFMVTKPL